VFVPNVKLGLVVAVVVLVSDVVAGVPNTKSGLTPARDVDPKLNPEVPAAELVDGVIDSVDTAAELKG